MLTPIDIINAPLRLGERFLTKVHMISATFNLHKTLLISHKHKKQIIKKTKNRTFENLYVPSYVFSMECITNAHQGITHIL